MSTSSNTGKRAAPDSSDLPESPALLEHFYREMLRIRVFERFSEQAYRAGLAGGYLHVYSGMEATAIGWLSCIEKHDPVITAYRDHGHALYLGCDATACMAEIMGRSGGLSRGKGGSMHLYSAEHNFYGGWGIVGGHTALGVGLAFGTKYQGSDAVTHCFFGDGAANAGVLFEVMNMASLWDLPVIFIIENNEFAMGTRLEYHAAETELHKRAEGFGMEHERIDGMDVLEVRQHARRIIDRVRKTSRPYFLEIMNYRFAGHGAADNDQSLYRTPEELERAKKRDPILLLENHMRKNNVMTDEKMEAIQAEVEEEMEKVYADAAASPKPDPEEVYTDVYTDMLPEKGH
ncbi:MAG: pyruvate dehydrogenase (acetyl-transferring) E1 component subunit alpha [Fimbriimonadales bacterium]|nr:pyruvate dehydrogenase (acetyl-transferring) E1 component subunit alpha [Fimbriimonadales bacterium]